MGQWGSSAIFERGDAKIRVMPHVETARRTFDPIDGGGKIDDVISIDFFGKYDICKALLSDIKQRYINKPYRDWLIMPPSDDGSIDFVRG